MHVEGEGNMRSMRRTARIAGLAAVAALAAAPAAHALPPINTEAVTAPKAGTVEAVTAGQVKVAPSTGGPLSANFGSQAGEINVGQRAWIYPTQVRVVDFPLDMSRKTKVGGGDYMKTRVKLSNTGILRATTRTWTTACADGFTGGVRVVVMDRAGNDLWVSDLHKYGVNGECVPGAASDRTEDWVANVPLDRLNETYSIAIVQRKKPTNRVKDFLDYAKQVADIAKTLSEAYGNVSGGGGDGEGKTPTGTGPLGGGGTTGPTQPTP
jgi:hypothetical protein